MIDHDVPPDQPLTATWYASDNKPREIVELAPPGAVRLVIYVTPELKAALQQLAARDGHSTSAYLEAVLTMHAAGGGRS